MKVSAAEYEAKKAAAIAVHGDVVTNLIAEVGDDIISDYHIAPYRPEASSFVITHGKEPNMPDGVGAFISIVGGTLTLSIHGSNAQIDNYRGAMGCALTVAQVKELAADLQSLVAEMES